MSYKHFAVLAFLLFSSCDLGSQSMVPTKIHVFATSNIIGYLSPCG